MKANENSIVTLNGAQRSEGSRKVFDIAFRVAETLHSVQGDKAFSLFCVVFSRISDLFDRL